MKTFAMLLCALLFLGAPSRVQAEELDILVDVSDSVISLQKNYVRSALAELGDRSVRVIPWSDQIGHPYVMTGKDVAEYFQFSGGKTNPHVALTQYFSAKPACRKVVVFIDGINEGLYDDLRQIITMLIKNNNFVMIVELSSNEKRIRWYQTLVNNDLYVALSFRSDVLTDDFQKQYPSPACMG